MSYCVSDRFALIVASSLPGVELFKLSEPENDHVPLTYEEAHGLVAAGRGPVYCLMPPPRIEAVIAVLHDARAKAVDEGESTNAQILAEIQSERARYQRDLVARLAPAWMMHTDADDDARLTAIIERAKRITDAVFEVET